MRGELSESEKRCVFNTDLCLSEVGLALAERRANKEGKFVVRCSDADGEAFLRKVAAELALRGGWQGMEDLRSLAARLGV
jgi:hypothetical protein